MKRLSIPALFFFFFIKSMLAQEYGRVSNPAYRYVSSPGFINNTELNYAVGISDSLVDATKSYFGLTSLFGYQINRNFSGGIGTGIFIYESRQLIPLYLEYKYNLYFKGATPYFYTDAGALFDYRDFRNESKLFLNAGAGVSRYISPRFEANFSGGVSVQTRTSIRRVAYITFKLGIIFRKNSYRLFKE
jgi:hypothetical protein